MDKQEYDSIKDMIPMTLDYDGLPKIGSKLQKGQHLYCVYSTKTKKLKTKTYKSTEPCFV